MKKALSLVMILCMVFAFSISAYAEGGTDAVTSASTAYTAPSAGATKVTPIVVPAGGAVHTVKSGDVMWKIAMDHGMTLDQLLKLNPWIKNANLIAVGQQILVKAGTGAVVPVPVVASNELYLGQGMTTNFRARGTSYYFCITTASVLFDKSGKIVNSFVDVYEIGQSAITWPTADATVTVDAATAQVAGWMSKRDKGDTYGMAKAATTKNEWYVQMDNFQKFFEGKTVAEIRTWFTKNTGATGKPINPATTTDAAELAKVAALTAAEKATLVDVISGATMSLSDNHSLIVEAIEEAYKNKVLVK
jgi:LysM repeat protein